MDRRAFLGRLRSTVVGVLSIFFVAGALVAGNGTAEVAPTWEEARVFLPGSAVPLKPANVPARDRPFPTVLYLHGCTGFDYSHDGTMGGWAQTLTAAGYAVAMPGGAGVRAHAAAYCIMGRSAESLPHGS